MRNISQKIKDTLKESGLSQTDLANKLGISRQQLHGILKENRKSKYLDQIAQFLKMPEIAKAGMFEDVSTKAQSLKSSDIQRLPIVFPEDILRIWEGHQGVNLLYKPFYNEWPFAKENDESHNHFCLRIQESIDNKAQRHIIMGAFHLWLPIKLKAGHVILVYLQDIQKLIVGKLEIHSETAAKSVINNKGIYPIGMNDILLAESTQIVTFLE